MENSSIYVKLKDPTGSFFIASQGKSVNRTMIVEVHDDEYVRTAIRNGGLIEVKKSDYEAFCKSRGIVKQEPETSTKEEEKKDKEEETDPEIPESFPKEEAEKLFDKVLSVKKITIDEDGSVKIGKVTFDSRELAIDAIIKDEKLRKAMEKASSN